MVDVYPPWIPVGKGDIVVPILIDITQPRQGGAEADPGAAALHHERGCRGEPKA